MLLYKIILQEAFFQVLKILGIVGMFMDGFLLGLYGSIAITVEHSIFARPIEVAQRVDVLESCYP